MGVDVTIGIPVYKSVEFIRRSLDSALLQTYPSIEFLIVDDAGHDGTIDVVQSIK
jgi:glycosyltransferase involved in cell wall biosynthesis